VLLAVAIGCGGKAQSVADSGDGSASSGVDGSSGGGIPSVVTSGDDDASVQSSDGQSPSGTSDSGQGAKSDAEAVPGASCGQRLPCAVDIACSVTTDCTFGIWGGSCGGGCTTLTYGVSTANTVICPVEACPPGPACPVDATTYVATQQDCRLVANRQDVAVACVNGQCTTYAVDAGSE
jgi:hypothetical protein